MKLKAKREYELELKKIQVWKALSYNPGAVISGETGDNLTAQLFAFSQANQILPFSAAQKSLAAK